jgi:uroporphyrinogen decarboxylase
MPGSRKDFAGLRRPIQLSWRGLLDTLRRRRTPSRAYHMELFQDPEVQTAIAERFDLLQGLERDDPYFGHKKYIAVQRFCGFDYVRANLDDFALPLHDVFAADTAALARLEGRAYRDEHVGPIGSWEELERYPWPDPSRPEATRTLEWYQRNLPEDMCIATGSISHFCELLTWLMGYESLCYALYDQRDLVKALAERITELYSAVLRRYLEFDRVRIVFASDDMGFKTGLLFSAADMIEFVLKAHRRIAEPSHRAGRLYLLHSCGNLSAIMDYLLDEVKIDGKHSFEDTIEDVRELKHGYGRRTALIGGIDVDFLCRAEEAEIRRRVRETLEVCQPGGGYCLGTGNSVANYIPLDSYLAMVDEGRLYGS